MFLVAYFFDCADGNFARHFNMVSSYGDYYDHISDFIKSIVLFTVLFYHPIDIKTKAIFFVILGVLIFTMTVHLGCQEKMFNPDGSDSLAYTKHFCPRKENIVLTRYVGVGTTMLYISAFMLFLAYKKT
jgi:phosphatidylglycerophosphate synthase